MNIIAWIVLGALAGWIGSMIMKTGGQGILMDIVLGIVGALVGGFVMNFFGQDGVTGFNLYSLLVAVIGAAIVIWIGRLLT
ncbi:MAG: GlsB/YeaQ/YmgE family stress response membrane protein [bacterium]